MQKSIVNDLSAFGRHAPHGLVEAILEIRLYPANNQCEKRLLFTPHYFDAAERALLASVASDDLHFVDIGASAGAYALFMAGLAGARAKILAVEPNPVIFERLIYNIRQNPFATVKALEPFFRQAAPELWPRLILCARSSTAWSVDLERMLPAYGYREVLRSRENIGWQRA